MTSQKVSESFDDALPRTLAVLCELIFSGVDNQNIALIITSTTPTNKNLVIEETKQLIITKNSDINIKSKHSLVACTCDYDVSAKS